MKIERERERGLFVNDNAISRDDVVALSSEAFIPLSIFGLLRTLTSSRSTVMRGQ